MQCSVYLPSRIEKQLNTYLARHSLSRSQAIQTALSLLLEQEMPKQANSTLQTSKNKGDLQSHLMTKAKANVRHALRDDTW